MASDPTLKMPPVTDEQWQQYRAGRDAYHAARPRLAPHNEPEWRCWLAGWNSVGINQGPMVSDLSKPRCLLGGCREGEDCPHPYRCWGLGEDAKTARAMAAAAQESGDGG